jgi:hypothetical protein
VHQTCTKTSTIACTSTMYHTMHINLYHIMHNPCTKPVTYHASTMHQPCTKTCTIPCMKPYTKITKKFLNITNHVPYDMPSVGTITSMMRIQPYTSIIYQNHVPCTKHQLCTKLCSSTIYHITHDISQSCHTPYTISYNQ